MISPLLLAGYNGSLGCSATYRMIHDSILPSKRIHDLDQGVFVTSKRPRLDGYDLSPEHNKPNTAGVLTKGINKNKILDKYSLACQKNSTQFATATVRQGKPTKKTTTTYPTIAQLVHNCKMKPSLHHQYRVDDLTLDNVIVILMKKEESYLSPACVANIMVLNKLYCVMTHDVLRLRNLDFNQLTNPRYDYESQEKISQGRVDLATAGMIYYGLHPGMLVCFLKGEYVGELRDEKKLLARVAPHISQQDAAHIKGILMQGCPSHLVLSEPTKMKKEIIAKGNQHTFSMYPELVATTMNKEEKHSHIIPLNPWVLYFSPFCRSTPQGIQRKDPRIIWDGSTKDTPEQIVLNEVTPTDTEAPINFGKAKEKLLINIYNWRISFPNETIFIALADITACFRFA
jgi:hypothetical protein